MDRLSHPFPPLYDAESRILILGSFPSVKSREAMFFYGHPQNRFWRVVSTVLGCDCPRTIEEKQQMLHVHHIALWDTIAKCDIAGCHFGPRIIDKRFHHRSSSQFVNDCFYLLYRKQFIAVLGVHFLNLMGHPIFK